MGGRLLTAAPPFFIMALNIITTKRKLRNFLTYDFEWVPGTLEIRLCGVFDGKKYRAYRSIKQFLAGEMTSKNRGKWFYAHAGGLADFQFILHEIEKRPEYSVRAAFSGSSAIIVHVRRGKNSWHFVDSYWLLQDKLENIGKWIGMEKGEAEKRQTPEEAKEFYRSADLFTLMEYNELDCVILFKAITHMQEVLWELGGQLQMTLASSAMQLFRRKFLTDNIDTNGSVNARAENAYFASRVEVFNRECWNADYLDINSSFPYAMTKPCPGQLIKTTRYIPDHGLYLAEVTVHVPECFLPPIPMRLEGRLFFPVGTWKTWLSNVDIELLQLEGGKILKVWEVMHFEPFDDLAAYAMTLYEKRKIAKSPFEKKAFKLLLNSLYGKFGEAHEKSSLHWNPEKIDRANWEELFPGAWLADTWTPVPHRHVPVSVHITAQARKTIYDFMSSCEEIHYCDTDGFSTTEKLETGTELGALKLEKRIRHGRFHAPKVYCLDGDELQNDGSWKDLGDDGAKAKGFSGVTVKRYNELMEGKAIQFERMRRIKELARRGNFKPREDVIFKRLQHSVVGKRHMYPDGHTRPWQVKELADYFIHGGKQGKKGKKKK